MWQCPAFSCDFCCHWWQPLIHCTSPAHRAVCCPRSFLGGHLHEWGSTKPTQKSEVFLLLLFLTPSPISCPCFRPQKRLLCFCWRMSVWSSKQPVLVWRSLSGLSACVVSFYTAAVFHRGTDATVGKKWSVSTKRKDLVRRHLLKRLHGLLSFHTVFNSRVRRCSLPDLHPCNANDHKEEKEGSPVLFPGITGWANVARRHLAVQPEGLCTCTKHKKSVRNTKSKAAPVKSAKVFSLSNWKERARELPGLDALATSWITICISGSLGREDSGSVEQGWSFLLTQTFYLTLYYCHFLLNSH